MLHVARLSEIVQRQFIGRMVPTQIIRARVPQISSRRNYERPVNVGQAAEIHQQKRKEPAAGSSDIWRKGE
jgi:hypothetical protein